MNIRNLGLKESLGLNLTAAYAPNCVESSGLIVTGIYVISLSQDGFETNVQKQSSKQSLREVSLKKVTVQKSTADLWAVISNQMVKYQLPHMRFD